MKDKQRVSDLRALTEDQLNDEILEVHNSWQAKGLEITTKEIPLSKSDVTVTDFRCVWIPVS